MKRPEKRNKTVEDITARLFSGILSEGSRLPPETKLAAMFHISRDTLRSALRVLESKGLIERIPGRGTFVRGKKREENRTITFLLPCADILTDRIGYRAAMITRELLCGAIREGGKLNFRVESVAVSPTNRNHDIDWQSLAHLNPSSRVIIFSNWYEPLFPFLHESGARTALITLDERSTSADTELPGHLRLRGDFSAAGQTAAAYLKGETGCRKICLLYTDTASADRFFDLSYPMPFQDRVFFLSADQDREFRVALRKIHDREPFDGLFLPMPYLHEYRYGKTLNENLGLPAGVHVLLYLHNPFSALQNIPCINYDFREIGSAAVRALCNENTENTEQVFRPYINLYSS